MNEFKLIQMLTRSWPKRLSGLRKGIGDDCAIIRCGSKDVLISTDTFVEGVDFERSWGSWKKIGEKCLRAALSDIAAMGGTPRYFWVQLGLSAKGPSKAAIGLYRGFRKAVQKNKILLAGGDVTSQPAGLSVGITVWGEIPKEKALLRSRGKPGVVFVTGPLGGGALAVSKKKVGKVPDRLKLGEWLRKTLCVSAMVDVSDGLVADLEHLAKESGLKIILETDWVPLAKGAHLNQGLAGGEDFELAGIVPAKKEKIFWKKVSRHPSAKKQIALIGKAVQGSPKVLVRQGKKKIKLKKWGYTHFS